MKRLIIVLSLLAITDVSFAENHITSSTEVIEDVSVKNNWGAKLKSSNFHLGLDFQTKYMWRGMEMMAEESSPVVFPGINYQWERTLCICYGWICS